MPFNKYSHDSIRIENTKHFYTDGSSMVDSKVNGSMVTHGKIIEVKPDAPPVKLRMILGSKAYWMMVLIVFIMIFYVTMVYGPIAAFLVELFPTKIRYTSMSLPYHIGNGVFGGLTPFIATLLTTIYTNDKLVGLMYPIIVAAVCLVIGTMYISNRMHPAIDD